MKTSRVSLSILSTAAGSYPYVQFLINHPFNRAQTRSRQRQLARSPPKQNRDRVAQDLTSPISQSAITTLPISRFSLSPQPKCLNHLQPKQRNDLIVTHLIRMYVFPHHHRTWIVRIFHTEDSECVPVIPTDLMEIMMGLGVNAKERN
jgi:hypothetical protein